MSKTTHDEYNAELRAKLELVDPAQTWQWTRPELLRALVVLDGGTVVTNMSCDKELVEWAKDRGCFVCIDRRTRWGNPYRITNENDRDTVCESYAAYFTKQPDLIADIESLRGKVLGCWCYPERCHGDELVRVLAERERET